MLLPNQVFVIPVLILLPGKPAHLLWLITIASYLQAKSISSTYTTGFTGGINPTFNFIDSFFVVEQVRDSSRENRANFPPESKIGLCENVTILYLGEGPYPGRLPPEGCYTLYDEQDKSMGLSLWQQKVADWHARHPGLAPDRKQPALYGDVTFPRPPFNESER